jgi:hypothetical protein
MTHHRHDLFLAVGLSADREEIIDALARRQFERDARPRVLVVETPTLKELPDMHRPQANVLKTVLAVASAAGAVGSAQVEEAPTQHTASNAKLPFPMVYRTHSRNRTSGGPSQAKRRRLARRRNEVGS